MKRDLFRLKLRPVCVLVGVFLMGFWPYFAAWAALYELPMNLSEIQNGYRAQKGFPERSGVSIYSFDGKGDRARVLEFSQNSAGQLMAQGVRQVGQFVDIMGAINYACESQFMATTSVAPLFFTLEAASEQMWNRLDSQALSTMAGRDYLDGGQLSFYLQSSNQQVPEQMYYLESYTWLKASELDQYIQPGAEAASVEAFSGTPWHIISAIEGPPNLSKEDLIKLVEERSPLVELKIRRAIFRVVSAYAKTSTDDSSRMYPLPFQLEDEIRRVFSPEGKFVYEYGRAAQLEGLESEAKALSSFASLVTAHHSFQIWQTDRNIWELSFSEFMQSHEAQIFLHSLAKRHTLLYRRGLRAEVVPEVSEDDNTLLRSGILNFIGVHEKELGNIRFYSTLEEIVSKYRPDSPFAENYLLGLYIFSIANQVLHPKFSVRPFGPSDARDLPPVTMSISPNNRGFENRFDSTFGIRFSKAVSTQKLIQALQKLIEQELSGMKRPKEFVADLSDFLVAEYFSSVGTDGHLITSEVASDDSGSELSYDISVGGLEVSTFWYTSGSPEYRAIEIMTLATQLSFHEDLALVEEQGSYTFDNIIRQRIKFERMPAVIQSLFHKHGVTVKDGDIVSLSQLPEDYQQWAIKIVQANQRKSNLVRLVLEPQDLLHRFAPAPVPGSL